MLPKFLLVVNLLLFTGLGVNFSKTALNTFLHYVKRYFLIDARYKERCRPVCYEYFAYLDILLEPEPLFSERLQLQGYLKKLEKVFIIP